MSADDHRLIAACLRGDPSAFGELVRRYQDRLFHTVLRLVDNQEDAQDVVQETFLNAYQSLDGFKGDALLFTWLYRIAVNTAISLKRKRKATVITLIHRQESLNLLGFPVVRYIDIDDAESVLRAIADTPDDQPIEIILHTPGGMVIAARQIASALADHPAHVTAVVPQVQEAVLRDGEDHVHSRSSRPVTPRRARKASRR